MKMVLACVPAWWPMPRMVPCGKVGSFVATQEFGEAVEEMPRHTNLPKQMKYLFRNLKRENDSKGNESSTPSIFRRYSLVFRRVDPVRRALAPFMKWIFQWFDYWGFPMKLAAVNHVYHCLWRRVNLDISRSSGWFGACLICKKNVSAKHTFICHHTGDNRPHWYTWCIRRRILHANDIPGHDCGR